jgi:hypothetical protein
VRLERIELTNYRSFGPGTTVIEFADHDNIAALIGANDAGNRTYSAPCALHSAVGAAMLASPAISTSSTSLKSMARRRAAG